MSFVSKFSNTLPLMVTMTDPRDNVMSIRILRRGSYTYLNDGWKNFVRFYTLYRGAWVRMSYTSIGKFAINVTTSKGDEVFYPILHRPIIGCDFPQSLSKTNQPKGPLNLQSETFVETHLKRLTFDEVLGTKLVS